MSELDIAQLAFLQKRLQQNYDATEMGTLLKIGEEIGCCTTSLRILKNGKWEYIPKLIEMGEFDTIIAVYCDMRISPKGIMHLTDRIDELTSRDPSAVIFTPMGQELERLMQKNVDRDLDSFSEADIETRKDKLRVVEI